MNLEKMILESYKKNFLEISNYLKEELKKIEDDVKERNERTRILWEEYNGSLESKNYEKVHELLDEIRKLEKNLEIKNSRLEEVKDLLKRVEEYSDLEDIKSLSLGMSLISEKVIKLEKEASRKVILKKVSRKKGKKIVINKTKKAIFQKNGKKNENDFEEINYYLDLLKNNKNLNTINFITDLIVKLKDGEEKDNLMADLSYTYNQVKLYNEAKDLLNKLSKENIEKDSPKILDLIDELDDNNDKKLIKKELEDKKYKIEEEKISDEENRNLAKIALDKADMESNERYLDLAEEYIRKIKNNSIKIELEKRLIYVGKKINFVKSLNLMKSSDEEISNAKLSDLLDLYKGILPCLSEEEKNNFSSEINKIITLNNLNNMKEENRNAVEDEADVKSVKELFVEFCGKAVSWVYNSKFGKKFFKKRLEKAFDEGKNDKIEKIQKILSERDIVSGVHLYRNLNKFNKLKYKVYKKGPESLTKKEDSKYSKLCGKISYQMYKGLEKKISDEELTDDKQRTIMILNQYFEALALGINLEEITTKITKILDEASNKGTLTEAECNAYFNEVKNMKKYFAKYNNDIINYNPESIENAVRYYDSEKIDGLDFAKGISYIRR